MNSKKSGFIGRFLSKLIKHSRYSPSMTATCAGIKSGFSLGKTFQKSRLDDPTLSAVKFVRFTFEEGGI